MLKKSELYDVVIALVTVNRLNPRKRWSDIAEKIMKQLEITIIFENGEEVILDDKDKEFR